MAATLNQNLCMHCMSGYVTNGVCNHCGRAPENPQTRMVSALPQRYTLHKRYILGDVLGRGGFGVTYAAWDTEQDCPVAVKEFYPANYATREHGSCLRIKPEAAKAMEIMMDSFRKEAMTMIHLQNVPGIIRIFHVFDDNNTLYFSMELLEGEDFKHYLQRNGRMQWNQLSPLMYPVFIGLDTLHQRGLIHRDISPDNIFICSDGKAQLIDFGLARKYSEETSFTVNLKECFSPWEQYESHGKQGPWTDVYAMGVTLYYALGAALPPKAPDRKANIRQPVPLSQLAPAVPAHVTKCIEKAMAVEIEKRYRNIGEFSVALYGGKTPKPEQPVQPLYPVPENNYFLFCHRGALKGSAWPVGTNQLLRIGRTAGLEITLPPNARGVSHLHCTVAENNNRFLVRDEGSSYGTVVNGQKLTPHMWYSLLKNSWIQIGDQIFLVQ